MIAGQSTTVLLQIGGILSVTATDGTTWVIPVQTGGEPGAPTIVTSKTETFGPFDDLRAFRITVFSGEGTAMQTTPTPGKSDKYARPFTATVSEGSARGVAVPAGSKLTLAASAGARAWIVERGTFSPIVYDGTEVVIGPFDFSRFYNVMVFSGTITIRTGWSGAVAPTPTPTPTPTPSQPVAVPSGFMADVLPFAITRSGTGSASTFATDYNATTKRPVTATTIYVSPSGTANGAGTQSDPVPSINMAIAIGNATGQPFAVEVAAGTYGATQTFSRTAAPATTYVAAWYNLAPTQDCAIYCPSGTAISTLQMQAVTWNATADPNIYRVTLANSGSRWVADLNKLDDTGIPTGLDQVRTVADATNPIAELNAAWTADRGASFYRSSSRDMWVRMPDNRQPTSADTVLGRDFSAPGGGFPAAPAAPRKIWIDNMQFRFGRTPFLVTASSTNRVDVYARNTVFAYGGAPTSGDEGSGSFAFVGGAGEIIMDRCIASYSDLDGFNYHGLSGATLRAQCPNVHEISCKTRSNGWTGGLANNGTTLHEFCTAVRINGSYLRAADRTIHDINRAQSWNLGCTVSTRRGQDGSEQSSPFTSGHPTDGLRTDMWLDACKVEGTPQYRTSVYAGSFLNYANLDFVPIAGAGTGTVQTYTA